jgi:hypothetical protein
VYRDQFEDRRVGSGGGEGAKHDERGERLMKVLRRRDEKGATRSIKRRCQIRRGQIQLRLFDRDVSLAGQRLGLKLAISIPGGRSCRGTRWTRRWRARVQIEPTNPDGFDWLTKSRRLA